LIWLDRLIQRDTKVKHTTRFVVVAAIVLLPALMLAQDAPNAPAIRVSTRLVQINVIVHDKDGAVSNLTKSDFVLTDQGKPREISIFSVRAENAEPASNGPAKAEMAVLPQNTFSDLPQFNTATGSITIVLLDNLNTLYGSAPENYESTPYWMEDHALANAKTHLIEFIGNLDPRDRVAIYSLRDSLYVLSDFTNDRSQLLAILKNYDTTGKTNRDIADPAKTHTPVPGVEFNNAVNSDRETLAQNSNAGRAAVTLAAMAAIAAHVANIPGRKNLVWLTANLPFSAAALASVLSRAQIAAYPIDARALLPRAPLTTEADVVDYDYLARGGGAMPGQTSQPIGIGTMVRLAELTGGKAFVNTNDITGAIRDAVADSTVMYTLGFYIDAASVDGKFHELKVQVKPKGLTVRYPKGYFATKDMPAGADQIHDSVVTAVQSPIESSEIPLEAHLQRIQRPPGSIQISGNIDVRKIQFSQNGDIREGTVQFYFVEQDTAGKVLYQTENGLQLRFTDAQYSSYSQSGFRFGRVLSLQAGATTLRIIVEDPNANGSGSVIVPLSEIK